MAKLEEKKLASKKIFAGRLLKLKVDSVKLPSGVKSTREIVEHPGAVAIIALTEDNKLVLVRQFRTAAGEVLLELPAGVPFKGENGERTARRELEEETGYRARSAKKVYEGYASPGYSNEVIQFYLAKGLTLRKQKTEADELIEVDLIDLGLCLDLVKTGKIRDNKTAIGVMIAGLFAGGEW
jgi:ADP-ribose pyrophosphatase